MESTKLTIVEARFTHTQGVEILKIHNYDSYELFYSSILRTMYALGKEYVSDITVVLSDGSELELPIDPMTIQDMRSN